MTKADKKKVMNEILREMFANGGPMRASSPPKNVRCYHPRSTQIAHGENCDCVLCKGEMKCL